MRGLRQARGWLAVVCLASCPAVAMAETATEDAPIATAAADSVVTASDAATTPEQPSLPTVTEQKLEDAWFTGPMLASGAGTLPKGRWLLEPYLFNIHSKDSDTLRSLTYVLYGMTDRITVGAIPVFSFNVPENGRHSSHVGAGDLTLTAQYRLTQFRKGSWVPTTAIVLREILPTGKHDRLDGRPSNGFGGGAYGTQLEFRVQTYAWMPNGRILRMRLNTQGAMSAATNVRDDSVYGTRAGFRGRAKPGAALTVNAAFEYSLTRNWVLATDLLYRHDEPTKVSGVGPNGALVRFDTGVHDSFAIAPAVEYSWSSNVGVLLGLRVVPAIGGRRATVTPAIALNYVY